MRVHHLTAILLLWAAQSAFAGTSEHLLAGCEAMYRGEWQSAFKSFEQAQFVDATCAEALAGEGAALLQMGRMEQAADYFNRAVAQAPEMAAAHAGIAACHHVSGDSQAAMTSYRRALTYAASRRGELRASAAWLACRLGLYESALADARAALGEAPDDSLARHCSGAALLALGRTDEAVAILGAVRPVETHATPGLLAVGSALLAPEAHFWADHSLDDAVRLAAVPEHIIGSLMGLPDVPAEDTRVAQAPGVPEPHVPEDPRFYILRPAPGSTVSGEIPLAVETDGSLPIRQIAVLLDDRFVSMSNVQPFRTTVDSRRVADGARELRVEGYGASGEVLAQVTLLLQVANGARTLAPEERAARRTAREELCGLLSLRVTPMTSAQLLGHALAAAGRPVEAIAAYEYVFAHDALLPGIRSDLLLGYREMGLRALAGSREMFTLATPGAVALTFDDGPHPVMTPWILDLLDRYGYRATFFLVGKQVAMYPELTRMIVDRGHEVGSHSHTHGNLCTLDRLGVEQELVRSRAAIRQACGQVATLFRPPGGNYNPTVRHAAAATGYTTIFWTENIGNYPGAAGPAIADAMDRKLADGGIVLLHNGYDETEVALPHLLARLHARGARCDTISALGGVQ